MSTCSVVGLAIVNEQMNKENKVLNELMGQSDRYPLCHTILHILSLKQGLTQRFIKDKVALALFYC